MMKCDVCETTEAPSYYTPKDLHGIVMCSKCVPYSAFINWHLPYEDTLAALKKVREDREFGYRKAIIGNNNDVMVLRKEPKRKKD